MRCSVTAARLVAEGFKIYEDEHTFELRVLLDRPIVEVFAQGGRATSLKRVYPTPDQTAVALLGDAGETTASIQAFGMMDTVAPKEADLRNATVHNYFL